MNLYYLTSEDYPNLVKVSFCSEAPVSNVQSALSELGFKASLKQLMESLNKAGFPTEDKSAIKIKK